jgi:hypothetical protein
MPYATRRDAQTGAVYVNPDYLAGARLENGRLFVDPYRTGGAARLTGNGTLMVTLPLQTQAGTANGSSAARAARVARKGVGAASVGAASAARAASKLLGGVGRGSASEYRYQGRRGKNLLSRAHSMLDAPVAGVGSYWDADTSLDPTAKRSGSASLRVDTRAVAGDAHAQHGMVVEGRPDTSTIVPAGTIVVASAWVLMPQGQAFDVSGRALSASDGRYYAETDRCGLASYVGTGDWQRVFSAPYSLPVSTTPGLQVRVGGSVSAVFWVDEAQVEYGDAATAWEPGGRMAFDALLSAAASSVGAATRVASKLLAARSVGSGLSVRLVSKAFGASGGSAGIIAKVASKRLFGSARSSVSVTGTVHEFMRRIPSEVLARVLAGKRGGPRLRNRLYLSNRSGEEVSLLGTVEDGAVTMSNFSDTAWDLSLTMLETDALDPFSDYVKPVMDVLVEGRWERFDLGLYLLTGFSRAHSEERTRWTLSGESPEAVLLDDGPTELYTVPAEAGILATVRRILLDRGIPISMVNLPAADKSTATPLVFDPVQDEGVSWYRICADLLAAGSWYALYADRHGRLTTSEIASLGDRPPAFDYGPEADAMVVGEIGDDYDDERFANRVVAVSTDTSTDVPMVAVAENRDPNSPGSINNFGRVRQKRISVQNAVSQAVLDTLARSELEQSTARYRKLAVSTLPDPRREPRESGTLTARRRDGTVVVGEDWSVTNWTLPLKKKPERMTHELARVERLTA